MPKTNQELINDHLVDAAAQGDLENIQFFLLEAGADPNGTNLQGFTPLMAAALNGKNNAVKLLLKWAADPHIRHITGLTVMECAVCSKNTDTINTFLENGCKLFEAVERELRKPRLKKEKDT